MRRPARVLYDIPASCSCIGLKASTITLNAGLVTVTATQIITATASATVYQTSFETSTETLTQTNFVTLSSEIIQTSLAIITQDLTQTSLQSVTLDVTQTSLQTVTQDVTQTSLETFTAYVTQSSFVTLTLEITQTNLQTITDFETATILSTTTVDDIVTVTSTTIVATVTNSCPAALPTFILEATVGPYSGQYAQLQLPAAGDAWAVIVFVPDISGATTFTLNAAGDIINPLDGRAGISLGTIYGPNALEWIHPYQESYDEAIPINCLIDQYGDFSCIGTDQPPTYIDTMLYTCTTLAEFGSGVSVAHFQNPNFVPLTMVAICI